MSRFLDAKESSRVSTGATRRRPHSNAALPRDSAEGPSCKITFEMQLWCQPVMGGAAFLDQMVGTLDGRELGDVSRTLRASTRPPSSRTEATVVA